MRMVLVLVLFITFLSVLSAEEGTHDGIVKINADEVNAAQTLVSLTVIPAIDAFHNWLPKAFTNEEDVARYQQQLIAPKFIFTRSHDVLVRVESYLRNDKALNLQEAKSVQDDLKILASSQFYCLEMYSVFGNPTLPMSKEEKEQLTQSIKNISKVYLGASDFLLNYLTINNAPNQGVDPTSANAQSVVPED